MGMGGYSVNAGRIRLERVASAQGILAQTITWSHAIKVIRSR